MKKVYVAIVLAFVGWGVTFGLPAGNFWIKIGITVSLITLYSFIWQKPEIKFTWTGLIGGILSAIILYGVFYLGNIISQFIIPNASAQVGSIYELGSDSVKWPIFLLLFFITGPGEEIFWRGFLQNKLMEKFGTLIGFIAATGVYGLVHIFSLNIMLIGAAFVAGGFWGLLYLWRKDLFLLIVSHSLWSSFIFAVCPIR